MSRPPRNIATERLVSLPLLLYAYIIMGLAESICCFGAYLWVFSEHDVPASEIFLLDPEESTWNVKAGSIDGPVTIEGEVLDAERQADILRQV